MSSSFPICFVALRQGLSLISLSWPLCGLEDPPVSISLVLGLQVCTAVVGLSCGSWGSELRISCLYIEHFTNDAISPCASALDMALSESGLRSSEVQSLALLGGLPDLCYFVSNRIQISYVLSE